MEVIRVENLSKLYDLGAVGTGTLSKDLNRWWARARGKEDPYSRVGQINDRTKKAGKDDSVWAVKDINFSVDQGEVLGIIGRNGAGKSTLLKIISRITAPTTGAVKIKGRIASLLEVGTGFHPEMTGRENIFMNGTLMGMTRREIQSKLEEIVEFAGVALYIDTPVKRYSSGMQVRLGFAVAAFLEPEILIVDEVLAVGDAEFQKKAIGRMKEVSKGDGRTVLFVSHNMAAVKQLCNHGISLVNGELFKEGPIDVIVNDYLIGNNKDAFCIRSIDNSINGQFNKIHFFNEEGNNTNSFIGGTNPYLIIEYSVKKDFKNFSIGMVVADSIGVHIYSSSDTDVNDQLFDDKKPGNYKYRVPLPLFNLNTGNYSVKLLMGITNNELFDSVELNFSIEHNNFVNTGVRPGLMIALNKWEVF